MKSALKAVIAVFTTGTEQCILFEHLDSLNDNPSPFLCPNERWSGSLSRITIPPE